MKSLPALFRLTIVFLLCLCRPAFAIDTDRPDVRAFIDVMVSEHDFERAELEALLREAESKENIIEAISRPAERTLEWHEYRDIFLGDRRINAGVDFWLEHRSELERISRESGVAIEILVAIIGVETNFGGNTGGFRVLDALTTLAFDYPPRSRFFRSELEQFLLLIREEEMDAKSATGSYAGAMGRPQFMPSSYRAYAVDSSADGKRDIWENWSDVIGSVANYFSRHGWKPGAPVVAPATLGSQWRGETPKNILKAEETVTSLSHQGVIFSTELPGDAAAQLLTLEGDDGTEHWVGFHNFFVITRYNRSVMYAMAVHQLAQAISSEVERAEP